MRQPSRHRLNNTIHQIVLGFFLACALVAIVEGTQWTTGWRTQITTTDGVTRVKVVHRRDHLEAGMKGEITWAADDSGIEGLGPGARFEIEERSAGRRRRVEFTHGADGSPRAAWFVDRKALPFDDVAREWLRQKIPQLHRQTGFDAAGRVARFLARGGVDAVLQEIVLIPGDHVQGLYFQQLLEQAHPDDGQLVQILGLARQEIRSDFEQAKVLQRLSWDRLAQAEVGASFLGVAETIGSDFELRQTLSKMLQGQQLEPALAPLFLEAGRGIGSDFEMASYLLVISDALDPQVALPGAFFSTLETVGSDVEQRRVLTAVLDRSELDQDTLGCVLRSAKNIASDFELAELLLRLLHRHRVDDELQPLLDEVVATLGSEFERKRVLAERSPVVGVSPGSQT